VIVAPGSAHSIAVCSSALVAGKNVSVFAGHVGVVPPPGWPGLFP
jgi:hypothetical protein